MSHEIEQYERWVAELSAIAREDESLDDAFNRVIDAVGRISLAANLRGRSSPTS